MKKDIEKTIEKLTLEQTNKQKRLKRLKQFEELL